MRASLPWRPTPFLSLFLLGAGCGEDPGPGAALAAFARFQDALLQRDESGCRAALTAESGAVLADVPWQRIAAQKPLRPLSATPCPDGYRVRVADPNAGDAEAEFVVVREYGRLVVDLVASAGLTARTVEADGAREEFVPRALTPADFDRIRDYELSQPLR